MVRYTQQRELGLHTHQMGGVVFGDGPQRSLKLH